jgi:DNA-binding transcriptional regulator LsrR (DeoR family)
MENLETDKSVQGAEALKRLMILQLLYQGVKQSHIAAMLGISDATMSRMIPKGLAAAIREERKR